MMLAGGLIAGGVAAHYANKDRYKSMARQQEQHEQLQLAQAQADEAERAAQAAELHAMQAQTREPNENKEDTLHKLEKLGSLRQQGLITEEEFQKMKSKLISSIWNIPPLVIRVQKGYSFSSIYFSINMNKLWFKKTAK